MEYRLTLNGQFATKSSQTEIVGLKLDFYLLRPKKKYIAYQYIIPYTNLCINLPNTEFLLSRS
jgi:hypothetical protein